MCQICNQKGVVFKKMGDLVLTEGEVGPVIMKLQQDGIEQTALHNHVLTESPRVMYMHISATGDPVKITQSIRAAHSVAVDQKSHLVYFPLENVNGHPVLRIMRPSDKAMVQGAAAEPLRLVKMIPLPGVQGRIDHIVHVIGESRLVGL